MTDMHDRAAAYVLDALDDLERRSFERHMRSCDECRREVRELSGGIDALFDGVSTPAPTHLRERVLSEVAPRSEPSAPAAPPPAQPSRRWIAATGVAAVVALVAGVVAVLLQMRVTETERISEIVTAADAETVELAGMDGRVVASAGSAVFISDDLPLPEEGRTYQLWVIGEEGPVSAGTFTPDQTGDSVVVLEGDVPSDVVIGLTEEPEGGSPQPTGDVLATAEL